MLVLDGCIETSVIGVQGHAAQVTRQPDHTARQVPLHVKLQQGGGKGDVDALVSPVVGNSLGMKLPLLPRQHLAGQQLLPLRIVPDAYVPRCRQQ